MLNPQALALSSQRSAEIAQLGLDNVIDCLLRLAQVITHVVTNLVARDAIPELAASVASPRRAARAKFGSIPACPHRAQSGSAQHRRNGPPA